jgi:xanthosine utilization system XapX-like protein
MIPLVGLVTVYCGYQLFSEESKRLSAGAFTIAGGLPVVTWVAWIIQMYV